MKFHFIFLFFIDGSSFFSLVFFQFSILLTIDNAPREHLIENKARYFLSSFRSISATSVKVEIISKNIRWETSASVFFPDSVVWIYVIIFFCSGKSENDLSVRNFSSHRAWTFI